MNTTLAPAPESIATVPANTLAPANVPRLQTILVPTDFSVPAGEALRRAEQFAQHSAARVILLHVFDDTDLHPAGGSTLGTLGPLAQYRAQAQVAVERELAAMTADLRERGLAAESRVCLGHAARQITATAAECGADLIVLSTHGRTGWKRMVLGSTTEMVVRFASCPVYTLHAHPEGSSPTGEPADAGLAAAPIQIRRMLVPTDFSPASAAALPWVESLARTANAVVTLLHVFSPSRLAAGEVGSAAYGLATPMIESIVRDARAEVKAQLSELCTDLRSRGLTAETLLLEGEAAERISEAAHSIQSDLIVLATKGLTGWERPMLGSTAERVVRYANSPVLVVRGQN